MTYNLFNSVKDLKTSTEENVLYGSLGIPIGGAKVVEVPNRSGFVYVRLRDSTSELIQAQNDQVSPVYGLPVILTRRGNKYYIKGRDTERYENWGTYSPFLPRHGDQHSFNPSAGMGGDVTFVYGNQFMPLLTTPSGSVGAGNVILSEYILQQNTAGWLYVGNTGTANLLGYKPTGSSAVMVLVYLDTVSGNPGILVGSGAYFPNSITGTPQVVPYIPTVQSPNHIPSAAIRLSSGTTIIGWDNIYDVKQYYSTIVTGTSGGGSSLPLFTTGSIPYAGSNGILKESNSKIWFDEEFGVLWLGPRNNLGLIAEVTPLFFTPTGINTSVILQGLAVGTGTSGAPSFSVNGYRSRGTFLNPLAVKSGDALFSSSAFAWDGESWQPSARFRWYADVDWQTGTNRGTRGEWDITPSGSATRRVGMTLYGDSLNLPFTGTYNVNGIPHTHNTNHREKLLENRTYYVRTDGNDSNSGMGNSSVGAFLTIQKAIDVAVTLDWSIYSVSIQVADGTYGSFALKSYIGVGPGYINGNISMPSSVVISAVGGGAISASAVNGIWELDGLTPTNSAGYGILAGENSFVKVKNVHFRANSSADLGVTAQAKIYLYNNVVKSGGGLQSLFSINQGAIVAADPLVWTISGTPNFTTAFANALNMGEISVGNIFYTGSATGRRYSVDAVSLIVPGAGGETFFPGNTLGRITDGGIYGDMPKDTRVATQLNTTGTAMVNITNLTTTLLAGRSYRGRLILYTTSNIAGGVKIDFDGGTATVTIFNAEADIHQGGALVTPGASRSNALATDIANVTAVTAATIEVEFFITVNTAGTLIPRFSNNAAVGTSSVLIGSYMGDIIDITG